MTRTQKISVAIISILFTASCGFVGGYYFYATYNQFPLFPDTHSNTQQPIQNSGGNFDAVACPTHPEVTHDDLLIKVNEYRLSEGKNQLLSDATLDQYAQLRAMEIATNGSYQANNPHATKYGTLFQWTKKEAALTTYSEDITYEAVDSCNTLLLFKNSPTHNDTIINSTAYSIGIGVYSGYVVLEIGNK